MGHIYGRRLKTILCEVGHGVHALGLEPPSAAYLSSYFSSMNIFYTECRKLLTDVGSSDLINFIAKHSCTKGVASFVFRCSAIFLNDNIKGNVHYWIYVISDNDVTVVTETPEIIEMKWKQKY
jgi:hypothetical protein